MRITDIESPEYTAVFRHSKLAGDDVWSIQASAPLEKNITLVIFDRRQAAELHEWLSEELGL